MLKFKNKFKFGASGGTDPVKPSHELVSLGSPRNSTDSRKTVSILSDAVLRVSLNESSASLAGQKSHSSSVLKGRILLEPSMDYSNSKSAASVALAASESAADANATLDSSATSPPNNNNNVLLASSSTPGDDSEESLTGNGKSNAPDLAESIPAPPPPPSSSSATATSSTTTASSPGLLTVKIYNSRNVQLPIDINNNKQILQALATNANNETTSQQLWKNINSLQQQEQSRPPARETIPDYVSSNLLPSVITIPNGDNLVKSLLYMTVEFENNVLVIEPQKGTVSQSTWNQVVSFDVSNKTPINGGTGTNGSSGSNAGSLTSNILNLSVFIRLPSMLVPEYEKKNKAQLFTIGAEQQGNNDSLGYLLIGQFKLPLNLSYHKKPIRLINHEYLQFKHHLIQQDMGEIMLSIDFKPILKKKPLCINDFDLLKVIGKGSFGKVMQVVKKDTKQIYALKTLRKHHIISRMEVTHTLAERTVLARIGNPFIVPLKFSFQSPEKLYLVLSFINGGELFWHLQREGKFSMDRSRFYIAELFTALESLHELNVIYRDLKPENILLDYQGHIALCDFGLCKLNMANDDKTNTFCGTPEYLAPELLLNQGYTRSVDWWTLGTLLYEMLTGLPPFFDDDINTMYGKILRNPLTFPSWLEGTDAQDLLIKLLQKDPEKRLSDPNVIKSHPFFLNIDWNKLLSKSYLPPFKPNVDSLLDTLNFDLDFTNEKPQDSVVDNFLSESMQKQFGGWTYNGDTVL